MWFAIRLILLAVLAFGARHGFPEIVIQSLWGPMTDLLRWADNYIATAEHPTLFVIAVVGLFWILGVSRLRVFLVEHFFGATHRVFSNQFRSVEQTVARQRFRWNLERAYRQHNPKAKPGELADMLRALKWPVDYPPSDNVISYSANIKWPDANGRKIWKFMDELFCDVFVVSKRQERLPEPFYSDLLNGRLVAAKFWDDWARQMIDGLLNPNAIKRVLDSNEADIKALAVAKLALGKAVGWDRSEGTTPLFLLARDHTGIAGGPWRARARRYLGGWFKRIGRRIEGDG